MRGLSVRLSPIGRAEVITPADQTPILDVVENARMGDQRRRDGSRPLAARRPDGVVVACEL
jgi:hypothetical protein